MAEDFTPPVIEKQFGVLSESKAGWKLELHLVSWGGRRAKYDIRSWDPEHNKMGKGVTFTAEELKELKKLLDAMDIE